MKYFRSINSKGQVTVPKEIRNYLGLGDRVEFVVENGKTVISPCRSKTNRFAKYIGALKAPRNQKEIHNWIRELRDEE